MRAPSVAVVAHDSVGDEVASSRRDVEEPANAHWFDRHNAQLGIVLYRLSLNISLAGNGGVDGMKESEVLTETTSNAQHSNGFQPHFGAKLMHNSETEPLKAVHHAIDDHRVCVRYANGAVSIAAFGIEKTRQESLTPLKRTR
jgi:hypothetical protein